MFVVQMNEYRDWFYGFDEDYHADDVLSWTLLPLKQNNNPVICGCK